jgi:hypothetical protein
VSTRCCCNLTQAATEGSSHPPSPVRRLDLFGWMGPGALLILLPKCPLCLAAYITLATGIGLSVAVATHLRMLLVILCGVSLLYFAGKCVLSFVSRTA